MVYNGKSPSHPFFLRKKTEATSSQSVLNLAGKKRIEWSNYRILHWRCMGQHILHSHCFPIWAGETNLTLFAFKPMCHGISTYIVYMCRVCIYTCVQLILTASIFSIVEYYHNPMHTIFQYCCMSDLPHIADLLVTAWTFGYITYSTSTSIIIHDITCLATHIKYHLDLQYTIIHDMHVLPR